ncbi:helix-turn-helix transcriptional regulator [Candidatus Gottesmanbacteria bacterium]|nr:helix-turn-helix transcriptional regulator [Candidatus Gottesmanbacteria bacterium]
MNLKNFKPFSEMKKELLTDPEVKKYYDELEPEYELIRSVIDKRLQKKMSQKELARRIGTGQSAISRLESGEYNPSFKFLQKIARALGAKLSISFQ